MFQPVRMVRIDCAIAQEKRKEVSEALQRIGVSEVEFLSNEFLDERKIKRSTPDEEVSEVSEKIIQAEKLIDFFKEYDTRKVSFIEDMLGVEKIEPTPAVRRTLPELLAGSGEFLSGLSEKAEETSSMLSEIGRKVEELAAEKEKLADFLDLNFKAEWIGVGDSVYAQAGISGRGLEELRGELADELGDAVGLESAPAREGRFAFIVYTTKDGKDVLDKVLRKTNCETKSFKGSSRIKELFERVEKELNALSSEKNTLSRQMEELFSLNYRRLLDTLELLQIEKKKCEVYVRCGQTEKTVVMRLWSPRKKRDEVVKLIQEKTGGLCFIEVDEDPEDAPTLLANPPVLRSFEVLTRLFSPPRYREVDPTPFIAPTFALFFGLMLTDAVYGIILMTVSYHLRKKYGKYSGGLYDVCTILMVCGVSAILFGLLTGSFLGDLIGKYILGGVGSQTVAIWLDPLYERNAITFLALATAIGFAHLFTGYLIGLYFALRDGRTRDALLYYGSWFILAGGVALLALAGFGKIPGDLSYAGYALIILGLVLSLMRSSLISLMEITGFVGNTLSYARLLALALTTSGIAMTFNFLASISLKVPYVGILLAVLVFIFGHVMNILINTLGGFVHSLRLHYLEFFGTFYQGGGREFTPFMEERVYTKVR